MFSALHLAWKLLRNIAVRAWRKMSVPTISAGTREGDQPTHPLSCVGAMNPQECDAAPWLTRLVADLASIAHAGCHSFQFGAPSIPDSRSAPAHWGLKKWNPFSDLFLWQRKQILNGKTPSWASYHSGAWLWHGISTSGFQRHRAPCSPITQSLEST